MQLKKKKITKHVHRKSHVRVSRNNRHQNCTRTSSVKMIINKEDRHDVLQKRVSPKYDSKTIKNYQRIGKNFSNLNIPSLKFIIKRSTTDEIMHETEDLKKLYRMQPRKTKKWKLSKRLRDMVGRMKQADICKETPRKKGED